MSPAGLSTKRNDLHQIVVDDSLAREELGLRKAGGEVRRQFVAAGADEDGADARDAAGDQHRAQCRFPPVA